MVKPKFDTISKEYNLLNRLITFGLDIHWKKKVAEIALKNSPKRVLDVATGTGDIASAMNSVEVHAIDPSKKMLTQAIKKHKNITFIEGVAENLPFPDNYFDAVTVSFGVRNFKNLSKSLDEIHRVLRKKGVLVILETAVPSNPFFRLLYRMHMNLWVPLVAFLFSKDRSSYRYLRISAERFPCFDSFTEILKEHAFSASYQKLFFGVSVIYVARK